MVRWWYRHRRRLLFALVALLLFAAAAEIGARLWLANYAKRRYGVDLATYREAPLVQDYGVGWRWGGKVVFRGERPVSEQKPPGVYRIITTGDSCCWGAPVAAEATFSAALERHLRARFGSARVEVLNAGVVGYNSRQVQRLVETTLVHFSPDLIVYYGTGEGSDADLTGARQSIAPALDPYNAVFFRSRAFLLLSHLVRALTPPPPPPPARFKQNPAIDTLQRTVETIGAKLLLVEYLRVDDGRHITSDLVGVQPQFCVPIVRTYDTFINIGRPTRELILDQVHPSALGHELIGRRIAEEIIRLGYIR